MTEEDKHMPRSSMDGSLFPALEQERWSEAHTDRAGSKKKSSPVKQAENKRNDENTGANGGLRA